MLDVILGICLAGGFLIILLGYLVKAKGMANLMAGYDPKKVTDKQGLTDWVGTNAMLIGAVVCLYIGLVWWLRERAGLYLHLGMVALVLALGVRTWHKASRN